MSTYSNAHAKVKIEFSMSSSQEIGSGLVSFEMIFEALQWRDSDFVPRFCKIFEISKYFSLILLSVKNEQCTPNLGTLLSKQVEIIAKKVSNFKIGLFWSKSQNFQKILITS